MIGNIGLIFLSCSDNELLSCMPKSLIFVLLSFHGHGVHVLIKKTCFH